MSKLPTDFVKAPAAPQSKPRAPRRPRGKASLISAEPVVDPKQLVLHLTDEEYKALEEARQALHQAGSEVTLEQMIHRVFADWMVRIRAVVQAQPAAAESTARDEGIQARLREFLAAPVQRWRELARQMWRMSWSRRWRRAG